MPFKCPIKKKEYDKEWIEKNKDHVYAYRRREDIRAKGRVAQREYRKRWEGSERQKKQIAQTALKRIRDKLEIYRLEGNACVCCGIDDPIYFNIDHVDNDGCLDKTRNTTLKAYLKTPERFQLLCANCNWAKHRNDGKLYKPNRSLNQNGS